MKKCPYCAEEIQDEVIKCKHCGEFLDGSSHPSRKEADIKWYFRRSSIIAVLCVGPLPLPLIWLRPDTPREWKIGITLVILAFSGLVYRATMESAMIIMEHYELLNTM